MDPAVFDPLAFLRDQLVANAGGYLRNPTFRGTCPLCRGVSGSTGQAQCPQCRTFQASGTVDRLGFMIYGVSLAQSGSLMYRYKDAQPPPGPDQTMRLLLAYNLFRHLGCVANGATPAQSWATVASLRRPGPHRLAQICQPLLAPRNLQQLDLRATNHDPGARRRFDPSLFAVASVTGHVLLLDDTWVTGNHLYSAAAALKGAGATRVTALVIARWLDNSWGDTAALLRQVSRDTYDPDLCPFTGANCDR